MIVDHLEIQDALVELLWNNRLANIPTILVGPAGSGKTALARRLAMGGVFRAPHHTVSKAGLIGTKQYPFRGEVALAHNGILFLDEIVEFGRSALEAALFAIKNKEVKVPNLASPDRFVASTPWILAASNPCPCGREQDSCGCTTDARSRYAQRLAGVIQLGGLQAVHVARCSAGQASAQLSIGMAEAQ